jgi:hypothetical protein
MNGYNNNPAVPFIDFEAAGLVVFRNFEKLRDDVMLSAAVAHGYFRTAKIGRTKGAIYKPVPGHIEVSTAVHSIMENKAHPLHARVKALGQLAAGEYLKYKLPTEYIGASLTLRTTTDGSYETKHQADKNVDLPAMEHFKFMHEEIQSWGLFSEYGRIVLFSNEHHSYTPIHRDYGLQDEFIWISITPKKFFVFNEATEEKTYSPGRAVTFNNSDFHGSSPSTRAGLSLRVDGIFNERVRSKLKELTT